MISDAGERLVKKNPKLALLLASQYISFRLCSGPMVQHSCIAMQSSIHPCLVHRSFYLDKPLKGCVQMDTPWQQCWNIRPLPLYRQDILFRWSGQAVTIHVHWGKGITCNRFVLDMCVHNQICSEISDKALFYLTLLLLCLYK